MCGWEDDNVQLRWPDWAGGANHPSLIESQRNFADIGAKEAKSVRHVRAPQPDEPLDVQWRPIDPHRDNFEQRGVKEAPWPDDLTVLYWWRPGFWRGS
ncbi:MAG: hypothetical protein JWP74_4011 [Marmoricola sp.]|nr:hypothetical protein [Marmoricola sp.]